jgi:hypothetical protein
MPGRLQMLGWAAGCHWAATLANARIWVLRKEERRHQRFLLEIHAEIVRLEDSDDFDIRYDGEPVEGDDRWITLPPPEDLSEELRDRLELFTSELGCSFEMCMIALVHIALRDSRKQPYRQAYRRIENAFLSHFIG